MVWLKVEGQSKRGSCKKKGPGKKIKKKRFFEKVAFKI